MITTLTPPVVTALTAGVLIIVQMILLLLVVMQRRRNGQSLGDGGNEDVLRAARRHGNFAENAAIFIATAALCEMLGAGRQSMEIMCGIFLAGRLSHAIGLSMKKTVNPFRVLGIAATVGVCAVLGVRLVMLAWPSIG